MLEKYLLHVSKCKEKYSFDNKFKIYDIMASTYSMKGKCAGGIYNRIIDCDGSLYPCTVVCGKSEYRIGNIYNGINTDWNLRLESYNSCIDNKCMNCNNSNKCAARRCIFMKKYLVTYLIIYVQSKNLTITSNKTRGRKYVFCRNQKEIF